MVLFTPVVVPQIAAFSLLQAAFVFPVFPYLALGGKRQIAKTLLWLPSERGTRREVYRSWKSPSLKRRGGGCSFVVQGGSRSCP